MAVISARTEVIITKDNAAALEALLCEMRLPEAPQTPSVAMVLDFALYAEERLVAAGIHPEHRPGCTYFFDETGPSKRSKKPRIGASIGIERFEEGWALYQAIGTEKRPGHKGGFGMGWSIAASLAAVRRMPGSEITMVPEGSDIASDDAAYPEPPANLPA